MKGDIDFGELARQYSEAVEPVKLNEYAASLGVSVESLRRLRIGWDGKAWTLPERDGTGLPIGISRRFASGEKSCVPGSQRGLIFEPNGHGGLDPYADPVIVTEGASDCAAGLTLGSCTVGTPSAGERREMLCELLAGRSVVIVGDNDTAGRNGAAKVAKVLQRNAKSVRVMFPPPEFKDLRDWLRGGLTQEKFQAAVDAAPEWTGDEWPELTPLREDTGDPPRFPVKALPSWLGDMVAAVAETTQTPPELAGSVGLAVLALAGAGKWEVEPKPGWCEPLNLFVAVALPPGCRKSAVFRSMTGPLVVWEKQQREHLAPEIERAKAEREIAERRLTGLTKRAAEGDPEAEREALELSADLACKALPAFPRLFTSDATPEAIARLLVEHEGRLGVFSAEGGELTAIAGGRYSRNGESNMEVLLKGHAGDAIRVDRANRERAPIILNNPAVTLALCVQPSVLESAWERREFADRGLLARFLFALPLNPLGSRNAEPPPVPAAVARAYEEAVLALLALPRTDDGCGNLQRLALTEEAWALLREFMQRLEPDLGTGGRYEHMTGWYGKLAGAVARIAGGLHLGRSPCGLGVLQAPVTEDTMLRALALGEFFAAHAERVHKTFGGTPEGRFAGRMLDWIKREHRKTFTERDLYRALGVQKADASEALTLLEETGHVRPTADTEAESHGRPGRKPSPTWEVNPALYGRSV